MYDSNIDVIIENVVVVVMHKVYNDTKDEEQNYGSGKLYGTFLSSGLR